MMKMFKVIFGLAVSALAFVSVQASADTQVNCSWQFVSSTSGYAQPYNAYYTVDTYVCKDAQGRSIASKNLGSGYLNGMCTLTPISPFTYTGTCQAPTFWEPVVVVPPKKTCPAEGVTRSVSTSSNVNNEMKWACYLELPECGVVVTSSNQSYVNFKCITK